MANTVKQHAQYLIACGISASTPHREFKSNDPDAIDLFNSECHSSYSRGVSVVVDEGIRKDRITQLNYNYVCLYLKASNNEVIWTDDGIRMCRTVLPKQG